VKPRDTRARIEELEQALDIERAAYENLLRECGRLEQEVERLKAQLALARTPPRRHEAAA